MNALSRIAGKTVHMTAEKRAAFLLALAGSAVLISPQLGVALDGTWTKTTSSTWTTASNWSGNTIADGSGYTANFSTVDVPAGTLTVSLNASRTIGNLIFGDTNTGTAGSWLVSNGGTSSYILTLAGTTPTITTNTLGTSATTTIDAIIDGTSGLTKKGAGTLILSGANTFTGGTTLAGGTLQIGNGTTGSLSSQALTFNSTSSINFTEAAGSSQNMGTLSFSTGNGTVTSTYGGSGNTSLTFSALAARTAGAGGNLVSSGGVNGSTNSIIFTGQATGFIDQGIFFGGNNYAYYDASGFVRGINWGVDAGSTTAAGGASLGATAYAQTTGAVTAQQTATFTTLNIFNNTSTTKAFTLASGATLTTSGILRSGNGTGATTVSGGTGIQAPANCELLIRADLSRDAFTISSPILANGTSSLTKTGAGTVTLSGANTYTGGTIVNQGTLTAGNGLAFGGAAGGTVQVMAGGTVSVSGQSVATSIDLKGGDMSVSSGTVSGTVHVLASGGLGLSGSNADTAKFTGTLDLASGTTLMVYQNNGNCTISGVLSGSGTLQSQDLGLMTINGNNTGFSGKFMHQRGTLAIGNDGAFGTGTLEFASQSGTIYVKSADSNPRTIANAVTVTSAFAVIGTPSLTFTGPMSGINMSSASTGTLIPTYANTFTGVTTVAGGTLVLGTINNGGVAGNMGAATNAAANLLLNSGTLQYNGATASTDRLFSLGGNAALDASGSGAINFANTGTYATSGTASARTLTLTGTNTAANTLAGIIKDSGTGVNITSVTKSGVGTWVLTGVSTYTGATNINGGTLAISGNGSINSTSSITINGGVLQYGSSVGLTKAVSFSGTGGKLLLDGSSSYAGALTITSGNTLGGHGTYGNSVTVNNGATLSPGNSPGQITVGTLGLDAGSTSHMEIGGTSLGSDYDNVMITNSAGLTYDGTLEIVSYDPYAINAQAGSYTLFSFTGGYSGELGNVTVDGYSLTNNSGIWTGSQGGVSYSFTDSTGIFAVTIPEPSTATLVMGVATLGMLTRRRSKKS